MRPQKSLVAIALLIYCTAANAMFVLPTDAPIDRLIRNTTAYIKEKPKDAKAHYTLARIHYLAFIHNCAQVSVFDEETPPNVSPRLFDGHLPISKFWRHATELALKEFGYDSEDRIPKEKKRQFEALAAHYTKDLKDKNWTPNAFTKNELAQHAAQAAENFRKAIELDPKNALYHLGLASLLEQYVEFLRDIHEPNIPEPFRVIIIEKAKLSYYAAYELAIKKDLKSKYKPMSTLNEFVGYEAAIAYLRLSQLDAKQTKQDKRKIAKAKKNITRLENLPDCPVIITPIVFSLEQHNCLADLLAPELNVSFDLDGDNIAQQHSWLKPSTAILVWDPQQTGRITSGRQLFGSVTWWIFFENGYHALNALDDNRDGRLSDTELKGLAVWHDKNSNAISEPGEVTPIEKLPILSIATRPTAIDGISPTNPKGLTMTGNRNLPTYDWTIKTHTRQ